MFRHSKIGLFLSVLLSLLLTACQMNATPDQVADKFWAAAVNNNSVIMKRLSSKQTYSNVDDFSLLHKTKSYELGKIVIDTNQAEIETILLFDESDEPFRMKTYLIREEDNWLIDYQRTVAFFTFNTEITDLMGDIEDLAEEFANQVEGSVEEFRRKALPKIQSKVEEAEKEIKQQLPEIKQKIKEFLEELERSIDEAIPEEDPKTTST